MSQSQTPQHEHPVTPLELFFDLVFVFAVSQLSHHLLEHLSWRVAAETAVTRPGSRCLQQRCLSGLAIFESKSAK